MYIFRLRTCYFAYRALLDVTVPTISTFAKDNYSVRLH